MKSCPETNQLRALRSGTLTDEAAERLRAHAEQCPVCRQELRIETEIDRELSREFITPEIAGPVIRELRLRRLTEREGRSRRLYRYLALAGLTAVLGFLVMPYLLHLPALRLGPLFSLNRVSLLMDHLKSSLRLMVLIGYALTAVSLILGSPRFRKSVLSL